MLLPSSTDKTPTNVTEPPVTTPHHRGAGHPGRSRGQAGGAGRAGAVRCGGHGPGKGAGGTRAGHARRAATHCLSLSGETVAALQHGTSSLTAKRSPTGAHDGIDIKADAGTQVLAASSGTVLSVADDDLMGTTVVIAHDGGYETTYSNLQSVPTVAPEQYVSAGRVIGAVGATSLAEASMSPHLHFSVTKGRRDHRPAGISQVLTKEPIQRIGSFLYSLIGKPSADRFTQSASGFVASSKIATASAFGASVNPPRDRPRGS